MRNVVSAIENPVITDSNNTGYLNVVIRFSYFRNSHPIPKHGIPMVMKFLDMKSALGRLENKKLYFPVMRPKDTSNGMAIHRMCIFRIFKNKTIVNNVNINVFRYHRW